MRLHPHGEELRIARTTGAPTQFLQDPVLPERASVYDVGVAQVFSHGCTRVPSSIYTKAPPRTPDGCERLELGLDAYYKNARDLLDDGQFGAALVLRGFNYEKAYNEGVEASAKYRNGDFQAYGGVLFLLAVSAGAAMAQVPVPATTGGLVGTAEPPRDLTPWGMFLSADPLVKAVLIGLAFASVVTWTVWLAKTIELVVARRRVKADLRISDPRSGWRRVSSGWREREAPSQNFLQQR